MSGQILRIVYYLVVAFVIGTAAQYITGYHKQRVFTTFVLGFIGVIAGDFIASHFSLPDLYFFGISILWSIFGAVVFVLLFRIIRGQW
jgi:uncharacterized membrane protein YeaQ/YmgE (transglycosylase-associated protein family)